MTIINIRKQRDNGGFTIVELMIASLVFSVLLLLLTIGMLQISRQYYKGITTSKTQETAREVIEDISQLVQFGGGQVEIAPGSYFCIGDKRYTYVEHQQLNSTNHVLVKDSGSGCGAPADLTNISGLIDAQELLQPKMRLDALSIEADPSISDLYKVNVRIVYGDSDVITGADGAKVCTGSLLASQYCAVSELTTWVKKRI